MERFHARLVKRGFGATAMTLPKDLVLIPENWSASDRGGCKEATVRAVGSAESLAFLCGWVGDRLEIYNDAGDLVWWGTLWDIEASLGNITVDLSLDNVYNRVAVIYPVTQADGSEESATTAWAEDSNSIARYGNRELLYGLSGTLAVSADEVRDQLLARYKAPGPVIGTQAQSQYEARLTARGDWEKAATVYFTNPDGLTEHSDEGGSLYIGRYVESSAISFGTLTPGGEADELFISGGSFDPLAVDDGFFISGAANADNNGGFTVASRDASDQLGISGTFVDEAAGNAIKVSWGDRESHFYIAQSFVPQTTWTATHVAVKVRQVGNPADSFRIALYPDVAGQLGTALAFNETVGSSLFTELAWTEFALDTPVQLNQGTTYWIGIRRTGTASLADGYEIALDDGALYGDGVFKYFNGTVYVEPSPALDMPFRVIGEISTTAQIAKAAALVEDFRQTVLGVDSQIAIRQYSVEERTVLDELSEMLEAGSSSGRRLLAWIDPDTSLIVQEAPASGGSNLLLGSDGKLRYPNGQKVLYSPGKLVYGRYVDLDGLMLLDSLGIRATRGAAVYVQESEYDAASDRMTIISEGAPDPWAALTIRRG